MYLWNHERVKVKRVIDGDTIEVELDLGFRTKIELILRLARINAPEVRSRDKAEKEKGLKVKAYVQEVLSKAKEIKLITYKTGKFGRYLCDIWLDGVHLNEFMLKEGLVKPYAKS